jgi:hypothetical protein
MGVIAWQGGQAHSEGCVALHRHHGHVEMDLRGRREVSKDVIEALRPQGAPLYSLG